LTFRGLVFRAQRRGFHLQERNIRNISKDSAFFLNSGLVALVPGKLNPRTAMVQVPRTEGRSHKMYGGRRPLSR